MFHLEIFINFTVISMPKVKHGRRHNHYIYRIKNSERLYQIKREVKSRLMLSKETRDGLHITGERFNSVYALVIMSSIITVMSFCELGPSLLKDLE